MLQKVAALLLLTSLCIVQTQQTCRTCRACAHNDKTEPPLPPMDNSCCGPHCSYAAPEPRTTCSSTCRRTVCLVDLTCSQGPPFQYLTTSGAAIKAENARREQAGLPRLIELPLSAQDCVAMNTKRGINCCCRELCPQLFCNC